MREYNAQLKIMEDEKTVCVVAEGYDEKGARKHQVMLVMRTKPPQASQAERDPGPGEDAAGGGEDTKEPEAGEVVDQPTVPA